jgi:hypothetical protein
VAHGICQTDASVIIASHDLVPRLAAVLHQVRPLQLIFRLEKLT